MIRGQRNIVHGSLLTLASLCWTTGLGQFLGGQADGFSVDRYLSVETIYAGSSGDGFDQGSLASTSSIYLGNAGDGFHLGNYQPSGSIFSGSTHDGFGLAAYLHYHKWTGNVGTGWLIAGNWEHNIIPTDQIRVCIPGDAPNMPGINAGVFRIGNASGASFTCKELWIQPGANLLCRINTFIINESSIIVDGIMRWKNQAANTFITTQNSTILIRNGGVLKTEFN